MASTDIPPRPGSGAARRQAAAKKKARRQSKGPWLLVAGLVAVVAIVLVIAVVAGGGGDDKEVTTGPGGTGDTSAIQQTRPVTVEGTALEPMPDNGSDPALGVEAPKVSGATFNGVDMTLPPSGTPTLLVFLAHWCPHCQREVPLMTQWEAAGNFPAGVEIFGVATAYKPELLGSVSAKTIQEPSDWLEGEGFPFAVLADSAENEAGQAYGLTGYPFFVMVDAEGKVAWRTSGEVSMEVLTEMINRVVAPTEPIADSTVPADSAPVGSAPVTAG